MKILRLRFILNWLVLGILAIRCGSNDDEKPISILVDAELVNTYQASLLQSVAALSGIAVDPTKIRYAVDLYKVRYRTTYQDRSIIASGLVALPKTTAPVSMISIQHGTITAHSEAPSVQQGFNESSLTISLFASVGLITVLPDYLGFGSSASILHPYYVERYSASAVIDNLLAARVLAEQKGLPFTNNLFLAGYSEGGYVTLCTHKYLETVNDQGFNLLASFPAAGGYDIRGVQQFLFSQTTYSSPYYLAYVAYAYQQSFRWPTPLSTFFREPYAGRIPALFDGSKSGGQINAQLTNTIPDLVQPDALTNFNTDPRYKEFREALEANSPIRWVPKKRMVMYHGSADEIIPVENSQQVYQQFLDQGATTNTIELIIIPGGTHGSGVQPYSEDVINKILSIIS
ncbi:MAG: alpha/beta fold hydrolase [Cyclobacteriaceae bacterium]|nr:alpha/beta fold hydrolase [Cyclobacteriaceae bacterium]